MIQAIISGGQTGADQGALEAAMCLNIPVGGYAPKGWLTEIGPNLKLGEYGLIEADSDDYENRIKT